MAATPKRVVVKLGTPADIVGAMPSFIGFHPSESLVVMCLHGPRRRNGLIMRFDLPAVRHHRSMAFDITTRVTKERAGSVILVCYTAAVDVDGDLPRADLVERLGRQLGGPRHRHRRGAAGPRRSVVLLHVSRALLPAGRHARPALTHGCGGQIRQRGRTERARRAARS